MPRHAAYDALTLTVVDLHLFPLLYFLSCSALFFGLRETIAYHCNLVARKCRPPAVQGCGSRVGASV
jgi:hypothetical protein